MSIYWFTGNTGAGKSTVAFGVHKELRAKGIGCIVLDGDEMRETISTEDDLSPEGRKNHNLRVARLAALLAAQDVLILVSVIAPFAAVREEIDALCSPQWIYVKKEGLTDGDKPYEEPESPSLLLDHDALQIDQSIASALSFIEAHFMQHVLDLTERSGE